MERKLFVPGARAWPSLPREFYTFFQQLAEASNNVTIPDVSGLEARVEKLEGASSDSMSFVFGSGSLASVGNLPGTVYISLQGDTDAPGNTQYYGSNTLGERGWYSVSDALASTADVTLDVGTDGITTIGLADLPNSGTGTLQAVSVDSKGRVSGTRPATITGTAGRVTVANGDASAGLPTIDLAPVADAGGGALLRFVRDAWGRIAGTSAATTADLAEGSNLYYTDARADARIAAQKGLANGLAPLGSDGKVSTSHLPVAVLGQVSYQGTWDASAGTPPTATPEKGWYYIVTVAGSTSLSGITDWKVGDWAIYNGTAWNKVDNTDAIASWNGRIGAVVPQAGDYTFDMIGGKPTTLAGYGITDAVPASRTINGKALSANVTLAASDVSAEPAITAGTTAQYWRGDKTWRDLATDVRAAVLTGLSTATNAVIAATDSVLVALGKLQAQITDNLLPKGYIDGLQMQWVSGTAITVTSGAAYIEGNGNLLRATSAIAKTGLSLSASAWYHVYLYSNAGTPDVEIVTTAPAAPYSGTARSKTGDSSRRYIGSIKTNASGSVYNFLHTATTGLICYRNQQDAEPFRLLQNGQATTETSVSAAAVVPVVAYMMQARLFTSASTASAAYFATSDDSAGGPPTSGIVGVGPNSNAYTLFPLNNSQQLTYWNQSAPGVNQGTFVDVYGYLFNR